MIGTLQLHPKYYTQVLKIFIHMHLKDLFIICTLIEKKVGFLLGRYLQTIGLFFFHNPGWVLVCLGFP